jgi:PhnB protein
MTSAIPQGLESFIPHLCCDNCSDAIDFYKKAFGAFELFRMAAPNDTRLMHAAIQIDGKPIYLVDDFPEFCGGQSQTPKALGGSPITIHRYVENCDRVFDAAVAAGATPLMPVQDMFWGDRYGAVVDPFGHKWSFATHLKDMTPDEMRNGMNEAFQSA